MLNIFILYLSMWNEKVEDLQTLPAVSYIYLLRVSLQSWRQADERCSGGFGGWWDRMSYGQSPPRHFA